MIEKIYIPTVNRVDNQITFNNLPKELQDRVVMVVQSWERDQYHYDCDYLVLPEELNLSDYYCLAKTRKIIYENAGTIKYCVLDDDIKFIMKNKKYWSDEEDNWLPINPKTGNPRTQKNCDDQDMLNMFNLFDSWLDEVSFCGCMMAGTVPPNYEYKDYRPIFSQLFLNGADLYPRLNEFDLTSVRYDEDCYFLLQMMSKGFKSRESIRYNAMNESAKKGSKVKETLWKETEAQDVLDCYTIIEEKFPEFYHIVHNGNAFRGFVSKKVEWRKVYDRYVNDKRLQDWCEDQLKKIKK